MCVESKKEGAKEIFEKIMTKNFTKLVKDTELQQIQEAQRENLKATTTKRHIIYRNKAKTYNRLIIRPLKTRWNAILKVLKEKKSINS